MKESQLQSAIESMLRLYENRKALVYIKNNSGAARTAKNSFIRFGKAGSPDFLVFLSGGKTLHLEVKVGKNRQTANQKAYQQQCEALGHVYRIVRSVQEVREVLGEKSIFQSVG